MKVQIFLLVIAIICASCSSRPKENSPEAKKADLYYGQGTHLLIQKEYTKALKNLLEANRYRPNDSKILNNLGMAYYFKGGKTLAVNTIKNAIEIDPKNSDARINLATIYMNANKLDLAEQQYKKVLEDLVYERQFKTYYNLATLALKRKDHIKAKSLLKESLAINENFCPASFLHGKLSYKEGQYKEAKKYFSLAQKGFCHQNAEPQLYLAKTLAHLNEFFAAEQKLNEMTEQFAMTKWEATARREMVKVKSMQIKNHQNTIEAKKSKGNFFTPDF